MIGVMGALGGRTPGAYRFLKHNLYDLEDAVWRFFEVEGVRDVSLAAVDKYQVEENTWSSGLIRLSEEGMLDRDRLLDGSLEALARDFMQFRAGWYSRFHEKLKPTPEERLQRMDAYLRLLGSAIPPTVSFAVKALRTIDKWKRAPHEKMLAHISPALYASGKETVRGALMIIETIAKIEPRLREEALIISLEALLHESPRIHERVLKLLDRYPDHHSHALKKRLASFRDAVAPSHRAWLEGLGVPAAEERGEPAASWTNGAVSHEEDAAAERVFSPIGTPMELLDHAARLLERPDDVEEVERVADASMRFPRRGEDPVSTKETAPLADLAWKKYRYLERREEHYTEAAVVVFLVLSWVDPEFQWPGLIRYGAEFTIENNFHAARMKSISDGIQRANSLPLLSTPTRGGFLISPRVLVRRALAWREKKKEPAIHDKIVSLLRLAPRGRDKALEEARPMDGEWGAALRYALGEGDESMARHSGLWIAASRARDPRGEDHALNKLFPDLGPDGAFPSQYTWRPTRERCEGYNSSWISTSVETTLSPALPEKIDPMHFTVKRHEDLPLSWQWTNAYWPGGVDSLYAIGVCCISRMMEFMTVENKTIRHIFHIMAESHEPLRENGLILLSLGLSSMDASVRLSAATAFIAGIDEKRFAPEALGAAMIPFFEIGAIRIPRLLKSMAHILPEGKSRGRDQLEMITALLSSDPAKAPRDINRLLEYYNELLHALNLKISRSHVLHYLKNLPMKGGDAVKIAQSLLRNKTAKRRRRNKASRKKQPPDSAIA
ncbi:MAG: hypothetical protein GY859_24450 [Desulfobacterales bacterium]|nr:hypothetical protein [Desulfobacterales bacterium]